MLPAVVILNCICADFKIKQTGILQFSHFLQGQTDKKVLSPAI